MCGIAGIFHYGAAQAAVDRAELLEIRDAMAARGPDGAGLWLSHDGRVGLAHRRLSIIDLSDAGLQPMEIEGGRLRIVFNGEIYNYRELRRNLQNLGHTFRSTSDTEVILRLYLEKGPGCVNDLIGMYAFALWDEAHRTMVLVRDPFGIKPLYYSDDGRSLKFASQVKALRRAMGIDTADDPAGHVGFFLWGSVPDPWTLYKGIRALPAGSTLTVRENADPVMTSFCNIPNELALAADQVSESAGRDHRTSQCGRDLREALEESVARHLVADVPVAIFLSSGLDSNVIMAAAAEKGREDLNTLTLAFREYQNGPEDEAPLAEEAARNFGTVHRTQRISNDDFTGEVGNVLAAMDQPTIDGVNTYFVCRASKANGLKVALSGLGGDELLGGYESFHQIPRLVDWMSVLSLPKAIGTGLRKISSGSIGRFLSPKYAGLFEYGADYGGAYLLRRALFMPWELHDVLEPEMVSEGLEKLATLPSLNGVVRQICNPKLKIAALEMTRYMRCQLLRDADWAGMAHSVEVRVPFVDVKLLRKIAPLVADRPELAKRELIRTSGIRLPEPVLGRRKTGFSVPVGHWLKQFAPSYATAGNLRGWARFVYQHYCGECVVSRNTTANNNEEFAS